MAKEGIIIQHMKQRKIFSTKDLNQDTLGKKREFVQNQFTEVLVSMGLKAMIALGPFSFFYIRSLLCPLCI